MKTKVISLLMILVLSASLAIAQDNGKTSFAIIGGMNLQNLNGKAFNGDKLNNDLLMSYHFGVNAEIAIAPKFYFQPGLQFSVKGDKNKSEASTSTTKINYIEMPLNIVYKAAAGNGFVMLGFGPYVAYGIGGNVKTEAGALSLDQKIKFKSVVEATDDLLLPYYKPFDAGANVFIGYEMACGGFVQLDTQLGLLKINPEYKEFPGSKSAEKNFGFGLSTGYRF